MDLVPKACNVYSLHKLVLTMEQSVDATMMKYLPRNEYLLWEKYHELIDEGTEVVQCSMCANRTEECILKYYGLPIWTNMFHLYKNSYLKA